MSGVGRVQLSLVRSQEHIIEVSKDGYQTVRITTANSTVGSYYGNIALLPLGIIGELIDVATGAAYSINPNNVIVTLVKGDGIDDRPTPDSSALGIALGMLASIAILGLCIVFL